MCSSQTVNIKARKPCIYSTVACILQCSSHFLFQVARWASQTSWMWCTNTVRWRGFLRRSWQHSKATTPLTLAPSLPGSWGTYCFTGEKGLVTRKVQDNTAAQYMKAQPGLVVTYTMYLYFKVCFVFTTNLYQNRHRCSGAFQDVIPQCDWASKSCQSVGAQYWLDIGA